MSLERSRLVSDVRKLCGGPPDLPLPDGLPTDLIFEELCNVEASMLRDLDLSAKNSRVANFEFDLSQDESEFSVTSMDFGNASYVMLRTDASSQIWHPVEIVNHSSLLNMTENGKLAIAFSGTPRTAYTSWMPDGTQTLRIWYERSGNDTPMMAETTEIGNLYDEYLKLQTAAQCREHLGLTIGDVMRARLSKSEQQWKRYANRGHQQGLGTKSRVFSPPRLRPSPYSFLDRRRYFVP